MLLFFVLVVPCRIVRIKLGEKQDKAQKLTEDL